LPFQYPKKRSNPAPKRLGSQGFPDGWNSLPNASSLKDSELAELINGIYSQYGSISKRQGSQIIGSRPEGATKVINGGMFYDIGGNDYQLRITDLGTVEQYNFNTNTWSLLTGTPPVGYSDSDPEFVSDSPVFDTSVFVNIIQANGKIYFASSIDRVTMFDGTAWKVFVELPDPTARPTVAKTGAGTGTRTYYYRYVDMNDFGTSLASPANDGGQSAGAGFYDNMPAIDGSTYLTVTLPAPATGTTKRMIFRGDTAGNEFYLDDMDAAQTVYIDKNVNSLGDAGTSTIFPVPLANTTPGYHFYLLTTYANSLVGTTVEEGKDTLVWSAGDDKFESFSLADGAGFDGYSKGDGQSITAIMPFSVDNKDGLAVFKDSRMGLLNFDSSGGGDIQNVNTIRGTMSPLSPHVAGNNIRFYSAEGVASLGHEANYGTILRYTVMSLKADSLTKRVTPANLALVCSSYINNLSIFGISTGIVGAGNDSALVYDERYNTWSQWTGIHPQVFWKAIHPGTKIEELYFGASAASVPYGGNVVKMFQGRTDYATGTGTGQKITLSITTKQYDAGLPDKFKKFDKAVLVFGALFGNNTTVQAFTMGATGLDSFPRLRISTDPVLSGFGGDEWGNQEIGMMGIDDQGNTLPLKYISLRQKDLIWTKINLQNDGTQDEVTLIGIFFYYTQSERQLPSSARLTALA
jgi:hypothetical protein